MHPVSYLFEEIYRDWGITRGKHPLTRNQGFRWRGARPAHRERRY